jgi:pre-mRNA-splicing factor ATP-dependent RNA helicase DHX15/PRP43
MTDGLLMREFVTDRDLSVYGVVIVDEAHERTINGDIILGLLKQLGQRRPDLRVVVMSATLEASKFAGFFESAPHLIVPGQLFPIEVCYTREPVRDYVEAAIARTLAIHREEPAGDVLVFLTGEDEIEGVCERIRDATRGQQRARVLPLYSTLPPQEQQRVFRPARPGERKIVVATNIAETSVTIDGIAYVVDPGFVKQARYQPDRRMSALLVVPTSQAAATQRCGRAGRTRAGKCFRLYTEDAFHSLPEQTVPEIQRADLAAVVLAMIAAGVRDIVGFPLLDPPPHAQLAAAVGELFHLGAIDTDALITENGKLMALMPVEPKLARALAGAHRFGCTEEIAALVALLGEQGQALVRPRDQQRQADAAHSQFKSGWGDHLTLLNIFEAFLHAGSDRGWCDMNYVNWRVLSRAESARAQLIGLLRKHGIAIVRITRENPDREKFILRALLDGLFMQVAMLNPSSGAYLFLGGAKEAAIHPSSALQRRPEWIMYSAYVFTSRDYVRTVSEVRVEWLFEASNTFFAPDNLSDGMVKRALISQRARIDEQARFTHHPP